MQTAWLPVQEEIPEDLRRAITYLATTHRGDAVCSLRRAGLSSEPPRGRVESVSRSKSTSGRGTEKVCWRVDDSLEPLLPAQGRTT